MDFEFKQGDKFDPSRNAIVRTEMDEKGFLNTTYITLNPHLIGWSLLPGIGIKSPAPEDKVLLADGSILDLQHGTHTSSSGAVSELVPDENGNIVIDMQAGGDIILKENEDGVVEFKSADAEKPENPPKPVELIEIDDKIENVLPFLTETPSKTKPRAVNLMEAEAKYEFKTQVPVPGKKTKASIMSTITLNKSEDEMFSMSNGTKLSQVGKDYFLEFVPNADLMKYLEADGKTDEVEITSDGKAKFRVDQCHFTNANGFHVTALGGKIRFDANAVSSTVTLDDLVFASQHTKDGRGADITLSSKFIEETYSGKNEVLKPGVFRRGQRELHDIDYSKVASKMPVDTFLALANLGEERDGIKRYGDEHSNIQVFLAGIKSDEAGSQSSLMLVRIGEEHYVYHNCELIKLRDDRTCEFWADATRSSMRLSPEQGGTDVKGNQLAILGNTSSENTKVFAEANAFLGKKGAGKTDFQKSDDVTKNVQIIKSNEKRNINVNTELVSPTIEPIKIKEDKDKGKESETDDTKETEKQTDKPNKPDKPKDDKKKKIDFWHTIGNALLMSALFFGILGMLTGGAGFTVAFMLGFFATGMTCRFIGDLGGFASKDIENVIATNGKSKTKERVRTRTAEKYRARLKTIEENNAKVSELQAKLDEYNTKGLGKSKQAQKLQKQIDALNNNTRKLQAKNDKALDNASTTTLLGMMGDRPSIKDIGPTTLRPEFSLDNPAYTQLVDKFMSNNIISGAVPTEHGTVFKDFLPAEDFDTLTEMTPAERAMLWGSVSELEEKYGEAKDLEFASKLTERARIHNKYKESGRTMTKEERAFCDACARDIAKAQRELGSSFDSWMSHIVEVGDLIHQKDENVKSTYHVSADAPQKLHKDMEKKKQLEEELKNPALTADEKTELTSKLAQTEKRIENAEKRIKKYLVAEYSERFNSIYDREDISEIEKIDEVKKLDAEFGFSYDAPAKRFDPKHIVTDEIDFTSPDFASHFAKIKYESVLGSNPITQKTQLIDLTISELDSTDFMTAERERADEHEEITEHDTEHERTAETPTAEKEATETPVFEDDPTKTPTEDEHEETAEAKKKKKKTTTKKTERTTGK